MFVDTGARIRTDTRGSSETTIAPPDPIRDQHALDAAALDREIGELAAAIAATTCRWLLLISEFEDRREHEKHGFACCARWLAWRCSISRRTAFEYVRVARALRDLPLITASFAAGRLSYTKVRALTKVADPDDEGDLLDMAEEATAAQLERILIGYRKAISPSEAEEAVAKRHFAVTWEADGTLRISGSLPAEGVEMVAGRPHFKRPDGSTIPNSPPLRSSRRERGRTMRLLQRPRGADPWTIAGRSRGAPFDLDLTVRILACRRE